MTSQGDADRANHMRIRCGLKRYFCGSSADKQRVTKMILGVVVTHLSFRMGF